jgi:GT2 family glycosyltransferase
MILSVLCVLLTLLAAGLLLLAGYLVVLTLAALFGRKVNPPVATATRRFAILIPAHNEEVLIRRLLENLGQLDYPEDGFDVYVVADNCDDQTASLARALGARVHERFDHSAHGKGFALRWLLQQIQEDGRHHDAFVVLDADSVVATNFLKSMDARLNAGSQVIQAYYTVLNPSDSPLAELRYAALAAVHYLRPLGRSALGLSCGLKGNGMCFAAPVLAQFAWRWFTLAEDVEFHLALARAGVRVAFAPETSVLADMPISYAQAASQNARWERGRLQLLRHHVPSLLAEGVRRRSPLRLDAAVEQLIPPLSVPFALGGLCLVAALGLGAGVPATLATLSLGGQTVYLLAGLVIVRAPLRAYLALTYAPVYIFWKVGLYARALLSTRTARWIRTARVPSSGDTVGVAVVPDLRGHDHVRESGTEDGPIGTALRTGL